MKHAILIILWLTVLFRSLPGVTSISGPKFLALKFSPKVNALGGAYTALYKDADALEENAAGTVFARSFNINVIATKWIADINYLSLRSIIPLHLRGVKVFNLLFTSGLLLYPEVEHFDIAGDLEEKVSLTEGYAGTGFSTILFDFLHTGIIIKYVFRDVAGRNYPSVAFDAGIQIPYLLKTSVINIGLVLKNAGYDFNGDRMPAELALGLSKDFPEKGLLFKLDFGSTGLNDADEVFRELYASAGAEFCIYDIVTLRGGVKYSADGFDPAVGLGSGLKKVNRWNLYWTADYAYIPRFAIDEVNNHQLSIGIRMYTGDERQENILFYEKYARKANLAYLKGDLKEAIAFWEQALRYKKSDKVKQLLEQTKILLREQEKLKRK